MKEGVRLDPGGISSRDWESYPVLRFSEVPEVAVELVNPTADLPPSASAKPAAAPPSPPSATPSRTPSAPASATCR